MEPQQVQEETRKARKQRFKAALAAIVPHLPASYGVMSRHKFPHKDATHIYNVKLYGVEDWDLLDYWKEAFAPQEALS